MTFMLVILPPLVSNVCVLSYVINSTSRASDGVEAMSNISVLANTTTNPLPVIRGGFNLCIYTYTFSVVPVTEAGFGVRSSIVNQYQVNYSCKGN